jgi:phosphoribosylpyrophosphate synthetase
MAVEYLYRKKLTLLSGGGHRALAEAIAKCLDVPLSNTKVSRFSDGAPRQ